MTENLTWRPATAEDASLLFALFASTKAAEFTPLGLTPQQLEPLLQMQFRARQLSYSGSYQNTLDMILCADNAPIGRHLLARQPDAYRTVDIAILPEHRGHGIGAWALEQAQQIAAMEGVPLRLSVNQTNPAIRLYERLGFVPVSSDELAIEMQWKPKGKTAPRPQPEPHIAVNAGPALDRTEVINRIFTFLRGIGLDIHLGPVAEDSFLPGIEMMRNGLRVDVDALLYPGDLLHEAGHLAVMTPGRRIADSPSSTAGDTTDPAAISVAAAEEIGTHAWAYAATVHLGLPPEVVFHQQGYRGQAEYLIQRLTSGERFGLPFLEWIGLVDRPEPGQVSLYPRLSRWLRETTPELAPEVSQEHAQVS